MKAISRRDLLKTSLLAPAAVAAQPFRSIEAAVDATVQVSSPLAVDDRASFATTAQQSVARRERLLLDFGWRFHFGNANDSDKDFGFTGNFQKAGKFVAAGTLAFDDTNWKPLDLPHDWAIELPFVNDRGLAFKGFYPLGRGFPDTSVGWYRRVFELDAGDKDRRISLEFDGTYRESMVVFNGFYIGSHSGGYDPFRFDVTDYVKPGERNILLVRVDATSSDGWFYEGAGIYRHVWLVKTNPVHVKRWGTFVASEIKGGAAVLSIRTELENSGLTAKDARVVSTVQDPAGKELGTTVTGSATIRAASEQTFEQKMTVRKPELWSPEEPNLYTLVTEVRSGSESIDRYESRFGIRSIKFDSQRGFLLNGNQLKIKGTCCHQDHAGVGSAVPDAVQYFRIRKLKEMGSNGLRTSHNPPTPELLNACDELGMLVLDETRMLASTPEGMSQFTNLVRRDRNHPSVFMWSMGNEEGTANQERGVGIMKAMRAAAYRHDGSRPVTFAPTREIGTGGLDVCDVVGYNYNDPAGVAYHKAHPDRPICATENVSGVGTRGIYITDSKKGFVSSYDPYGDRGHSSEEGWWRFLDSQEWLGGGFVWTGFDYRGEPSPYSWPNISSQYGIIDTCGFPKDTFFYYQSWWTQKPVLHLFPHWNWAGYEGKGIAVWVYSNLEKIELLLNGQSVGMKEMKKNQHLAWNVTYQPGVIEARGYRDDKLILTERRVTSSEATTLALSADRLEIAANGEDVTMVAVVIRDAKGLPVPVADNEVTFKVTGTGRIIGTGNGDPTDHTACKSPVRKAFSGLCMGLVQASKTAGVITIEVSSPNLSPASLRINANGVALRPQLPVWDRKIPQGSGASGLWRPLFSYAPQLFILEQQGSSLTGSAEGSVLDWIGGDDTPMPIVDGKVVGNTLSFKVGLISFWGTFDDNRMELNSPVQIPSNPEPSALKLADETLAIGPPPDNSNPSSGSIWRMPNQSKLVLRRVNG